jgi:zinc/manganese transport system substrate-binding protein
MQCYNMATADMPSKTRHTTVDRDGKPPDTRVLHGRGGMRGRPLRIAARHMCAIACALSSWLIPGWSAQAQTAPIRIVAAENFYGDVARQIGGPEVGVTSIITAPGQDPHQFEASPAAARALSEANLVIYNGANYDPWIDKLLANTAAAARRVIAVAAVVNAKPGDNPHLWYDPATMPVVATRIADELQALDSAHADAYRGRLASFLGSLAPISAAIAAITAKYAGTPVTATEPVFGPMAKALGFVMRNERFQLAVMNDTEPSASDVAAMQDDLKRRKVRLLLYNSQVSDDLTERLLAIARTAKVPVVGITETAPAGKSYQAWITGELDAVRSALDGGGS